MCLNDFKIRATKRGFIIVAKKFMGTLSGKVTVIYILSFSRRVYSQRKEYAPFGANSFL